MGYSCGFNVFQSLQPLFSTKAGCKIHSKGRNVGNYINERKAGAKAFFGRNEIFLSCHIFSWHLSLSDLLATGQLSFSFPAPGEGVLFQHWAVFWGLDWFCSELESASEVEAVLVPLTAETEMHPSHGRVIFLSCHIPLMRKVGKTLLLW